MTTEMNRRLALMMAAGLATSAAAFAGDCPGDCNGDGMASVLDFVCFQGEWQNQTDAGDCNGDGMYSILDFVCFQGAWQDFQQNGCPGGCDNLAPDMLDEDFESYPLGDLCGQCGWEPWDLADAVCADVVDTLANSGAQSLNLLANDDMVQVFDIQDGQWTVRAMTYVPEGNEGLGYFIMLNTFEQLGAKDWSVQIAFDPLSNIVTADLQGGAAVALQTDAWVELRLELDLDAGTVNYFYDDEQFVFDGPWVGLDTSIQCIDLYSAGLDFYYDDVSLLPAP